MYNRLLLCHLTSRVLLRVDIRAIVQRARLSHSILPALILVQNDLRSPHTLHSIAGWYNRHIVQVKRFSIIQSNQRRSYQCLLNMAERIQVTESYIKRTTSSGPGSSMEHTIQVQNPGMASVKWMSWIGPIYTEVRYRLCNPRSPLQRHIQVFSPSCHVRSKALYYSLC